MWMQVKRLIANLALAAVSLLVSFAVLELVVFRYVLVPDDLLTNVTVDGVVRYQPGTKAVFRHPDGRESVVAINSTGWNSTRRHFPLERTPGVLRIAVVGDSYVHGGFVDVDQAYPEVLEQRLIASGIETEVFRFGMDGAPLSQYLHMLRREVVRYKPDIVLVGLIHNDFDESYRRLKTRYASSFLKLADDGAGRIVEVSPADFEPGLADRLRYFATFRYLYYETGLYLRAKSSVSRLFWGGEEEWDKAFLSSAVDIRKINDHDANRRFARYAMAQMKALAGEHGFRLAFVMDGVRDAIYEGRRLMDYEVGRLNGIAAELTAELAIPFLDLHETFARDFAEHGKRLEFSYDWHWNVRANRIAAEAIERMLMQDGRLSGGRIPGPPRTGALSVEGTSLN